MFEIIKGIILGIVEGITEWLPISSTGHLILVNELIRNKNCFTSSDLFLYVIQLGAILAVVTMYFHRLNPFSPSKTSAEKAETWETLFKIIIGCLPAAIVGLCLESYMESLENWKIVSAMLIVYGIAFIIAENYGRKEKIFNMKDMTYKTAFLIGLFQVLSIIPGTSRSGATILGAILVGCARPVAAEFTFFMAIPVMFGVSIIKIAKYGLNMDIANWIVLIISMAVAYVVSLISVKFLTNYVKKHDFKVFGVYRIILGALVIAFFLICN